MTLPLSIPAALAALPLQAEGGGVGGLTSQLPMLILVFAAFYFLMIRPQQKARKEHEELLTTLKKGDEVVSEGGIVGTIFAVEDEIVVLEINDKTRMRIKKESISGRYGKVEGDAS